MKKKLLLLLFLAAVGLTGCNSLPIESSGSPQGKHSGEIIQASLYDFRWKEYKIVKQTGEAGFYRVSVCNNYLFSLATVLTFGLYAPIEIEWWPQAEPPRAYSGKKWKGQ